MRWNYYIYPHNKEISLLDIYYIINHNFGYILKRWNG